MPTTDQLLADLNALGLKTLGPDHFSGRNPGFDAQNLSANVAVCPRNTQEVAQLVRHCAAHKIPLVPQGGRTGLAGGAQSKPGQVIVMMDGLAAQCQIDADARTATVDAGVTLQKLEEAANTHGLTAGIDIAARGSCTIGGMVATNAGGGEAFRHGTMRHRVLGLEAVLPDGTVLNDLKQVIKSNEGYDVKQLLIGSEGTLGIITYVVLRLEKAPKHRRTILAETSDAAATLAFFNRLRARFGDKLLLAEIMWRDYFDATCAELGATIPLGQNGGKTFFIADIDAERESDLMPVLEAGLSEGELLDALIAQNHRERATFWQIREDSFLIDKRLPGGCWFDISIPLPQLDHYVRDSAARIKAVAPGLRIFVMGHLGDGNLHYTVAADRPVPELYDDVSAALYEGLADIGGSFSAEHGVGVEKRTALQKFGDPGRLAMMRAVKQALDPLNIMNPGKVLG